MTLYVSFYTSRGLRLASKCSTFSASSEILLAVVYFSFYLSNSMVLYSVVFSQSISASCGTFIPSYYLILLCLRWFFLFRHFPSSFSDSGGAICPSSPLYFFSSCGAIYFIVTLLSSKLISCLICFLPLLSSSLFLLTIFIHSYVFSVVLPSPSIIIIYY